MSPSKQSWASASRTASVPRPSGGSLDSGTDPGGANVPGCSGSVSCGIDRSGNVGIEKSGIDGTLNSGNDGSVNSGSESSGTVISRVVTSGTVSSGSSGTLSSVSMVSEGPTDESSSRRAKKP